MNNPNITLSQVRAALDLKIQSLIAETKLASEKCRLSLYSYQTELTNKIVTLPDVETLRKNQIQAMKAFSFFKDQISIHFQLSGNYYGIYPCIPSDFIDYRTRKVDIKRRDFRVSVTGYCKVKNHIDTGFSFNYQSVVIVKSSLVKELLLKWQDGVVEYLKYEETFKRINLFIKNFEAESQLVLLQLQNPDEHKALMDYTDSYIKDRLTIS